MIIDQYYPDYEGRAYLYKRWRDPDGNLIEERIGPDQFEPYFYVKKNHAGLDRVLQYYEGSRVATTETAEGLHGEELVKVYVNRPGEIGQIRRQLSDNFINTWEGDMRYPDKYLIDMVPEMPDWKPRVWHFDLEWDPEHDFTTVMAVVDSFTDKRVAFCWSEDSSERLADGEAEVSVRTIETDDSTYTYERVLLNSEEAVHDAFMDYYKECDPDILVAHAIMWADLPHMVRRMKNFRQLSPLNRVRKPKKTKRGYDYTDQPITGKLCFDTAAPYESGTGFERVWKDSGNPQLASRKLDFIAKELGYGGKFDMDVFTGWYERFDDYVDYCMQDTVLVKKIDEDKHVLEFFLSLQRLCGVMFASCHNVTRFARGLLSRRTHWKIPSRHLGEKEEFQGAHIPPPVPGRYEGVAVVDYKGLYPSIILSHNLSWETQVESEGEGIHKLSDGSYWDQTKKGLLPQIVEEMFELRDDYKAKMKEAKTQHERDGWNTMQLAVKRVMASFYGMVTDPHWGWNDYTIGRAITACGREAIMFLLEESERQGYHPVYGHTDSAFVQVPFDEAPALAKHLTKEVQLQLNAKDLVVELEAYMPYWLIAGKNLYYGICSWPPEEEGKVKSARFGKISTLAPISRDLERDTLNAICKGATEREVVEEVRKLSLRIKKGDVEIAEITGTTRIQKKLKEYNKSIGVPGVKAALYYNAHMLNGGTPYGKGDSVPWVYVLGSPDNLPSTDIMTYRDESDLEGFELDWEKMVDRLVSRKIKPIFKALDWDLKKASGEAMPKKYW